MLALVHMQLHLPHDMDPAKADALLEVERNYALEQQRQGSWLHIWRTVGRTGNYSVFNTTDLDELHRIIAGLPLYPYLEVEVTPLAAHPSALTSDTL